MFEGGIVSAIEAGTPQGSPISPLLANIALHVLDEAWAGGGHRLGELVKYADDLVILCATREQAEEARELVAAVLDGLGLRLAPGEDQDREPRPRRRRVHVSGVRASDARVVEAAGSLVSAEVAVPTGDGLDQRQDPRPHRTPLRQAAVGMGRRGSQPRAARLGELLPLRKLRARSSTTSTPTSTNASRSSPAPSTDSKGRNWSHRFNYEWVDPARHLPPQRNGETDACVCQPVNDVGEPCAGEPHARFDAAAGGNPGPVGQPARSPDASRRPYPAATRPALLLSITAGSEQTSTHRSGRPATRLVVRESSIELMIERSLPSSRSAHAAHGAACLETAELGGHRRARRSRAQPPANPGSSPNAPAAHNHRGASGAKSSSNQPSALKPTRSRSPPLPRIRSSIAATATHARATHTAARVGPTAKCSPNTSRA